MRKNVIRLIIGVAAYAVGIIFDLSWYIFLVPYLIIGGDVIYKAVRNIFRGQVFDENFLMTIATIGAFCINEPVEAVAVMLFYQVGEAFQDYAVNRSRRSIAELMDIKPDYANIEADGDLIQVDPYDVNIGDVIVVKAGEKIPLDGIVLEGRSSLDTSALTGEVIPLDVESGSEVISGSVNKTGLLKIEVTRPFDESTVSKILDMVENASNKKSKSENFITKFARYYTPVVVGLAVLIAVVPSVITGDWAEWIKRAVILIFLSCPCALVISVPLSFFGGIGGASRQGILVKGSNYLEVLADIDTFVFDKTGTLTEGKFKVTKIQPIDPVEISESELLKYAAYAESYSDHPIARSVVEAYGAYIDKSRISEFEELSGYGISVKVDGKTVRAGNNKLIKAADISDVGTIVHVEIDGKYCGYLVISDEIKRESYHLADELKKSGVKKTVMLTGDRDSAGKLAAEKLRIDEVYTELLPGDKVTIVEKLLEEGKVAFVGDGINDAPVLSRSDVGFAMGGVGSDAAIEAADIVLMDDNPNKIITARKIADKTLRIVRQNIIFALGIKFIVMVLGIFGSASMWMAVFADVGVSVIAVINAMRAMKIKN